MVLTVCHCQMPRLRRFASSRGILRLMVRKKGEAGVVGFDFGLFTGLSVEADSLDALLNASISLATPESERKRGDRFRSNDEFELESSVNEDWLKWSPVIELGT